jgi:hypothetical protein
MPSRFAGVWARFLLYLLTPDFGDSLIRVIRMSCVCQEWDVMDDTNLEDKVNELVQEFGDAVDPQHKKLASLAREAQANQKKLERSINSLQESLDYLRVCIKYQIFDLEATRRENEYLRKMLEEEDRE